MLSDCLEWQAERADSNVVVAIISGEITRFLLESLDDIKDSQTDVYLITDSIVGHILRATLWPGVVILILAY